MHALGLTYACYTRKCHTGHKMKTTDRSRSTKIVPLCGVTNTLWKHISDGNVRAITVDILKFHNTDRISVDISCNYISYCHQRRVSFRQYNAMIRICLVPIVCWIGSRTFVFKSGIALTKCNPFNSYILSHPRMSIASDNRGITAPVGWTKFFQDWILLVPQLEYSRLARCCCYVTSQGNQQPSYRLCRKKLCPCVPGRRTPQAWITI